MLCGVFQNKSRLKNFFFYSNYWNFVLTKIFYGPVKFILTGTYCIHINFSFVIYCMIHSPVNNPRTEKIGQEYNNIYKFMPISLFKLSIRDLKYSNVIYIKSYDNRKQWKPPLRVHKLFSSKIKQSS